MVVKEQERQAQNFPIQNTVADAVWTAVYNFTKFRKDNPEYKYKLALQIHDALLFLVPISQLRMFLDNCLRKCMIDDVPIYPRRTDNTLIEGAGPYHFAIDYDVELNWGESITPEQAEANGIPLDLI